MNIEDLSLNFGTQEVFKNVNLMIPEKEKVGIVGVNGAGKTTLFKIVMGEEETDNGSIRFKKGYRVDWLPQVISDEISDMKINVYKFLQSGRPIEKIEARLQKLYEEISLPGADIDNIYKRIEITNRELDYWESYSANSTLLKIIDGIGITKDMLDKKLCELSGGQKSKVAFARLLYSKPEVILLDEPTNHMDKDSKDYIIDYLKNYKGSVFVISHDIDFLNKITTKILFIDKRTKDMKLFDGNYDKFKKLETEYESQLEKEAEKQQKEEDKLREIVNKYANSSGKRKRMAQDREKKLEKLLENKVEVMDKNKTMKLKMEMNQDLNNMPLSIKNISFAYDKENIINNLSFDLYKGEKLLIVGHNGVGKSTLLKLLVGLLIPNTGEIKIGSKVEIGYYAQELEGLDNDLNILDNFKSTGLTPNKIRSVLGNFLFHGDDVFKKVKVLSPGEKARVALAKLSVSGANLLLLDEPTNHLDPETQNIIGEVFKTFEGSMIIVSHNPEFVKMLGIERTITLPSGKISYYDEDLVKYYHEENTKSKKHK